MKTLTIHEFQKTSQRSTYTKKLDPFLPQNVRNILRKKSYSKLEDNENRKKHSTSAIIFRRDRKKRGGKEKF